MRLASSDPRRDYRWGVAALFAAWLAVPLTWQAVRLTTLWLGIVPESRAAITVDDLGAIDRWFERTFPQRGQLFGLYNKIRHGVFGQFPAAVVEGADGWLFWRSESAGEPGLDDFAGLVVPSAAELERWRAAFIARRADLEARGIAYVAAIAPNKHTIYPDMLPLALRGRGARTRLDRIMDAFGGRTPGFLDLRPALRAARERGPVFYRTDTHWNDAGAYAAYRAIVVALAQQRPELAALPRACFGVETDAYVGDIARMIRMTIPEHTERWVWRLPQSTECAARPESSPRPTLVLFRDSYATWLMPFLERQFTVLAIGHRFAPALVRRLSPDVVIHEVAERYVPNLFDVDPDERTP